MSWGGKQGVIQEKSAPKARQAEVIITERTCTRKRRLSRGLTLYRGATERKENTRTFWAFSHCARVL